MGKVCPLPIMEFSNRLESRSSIFNSAYLWENLYDSIVRESLQISIGGSPSEESTCAEFEPTIGVGALQIKIIHPSTYISKVNGQSVCDVGKAIST